jgi:8-amino-7-oxononanoate synthase
VWNRKHKTTSLQTIPKHWQQKLNQRIENNSFRELRVFHGLVDFYSNDYLGIARNNTINNLVNITLTGQKEQLNGSTGSRLLSGNHIWARRCEFYLSEFYQSETAVLFNSGYDANLGIMACLADRNDTIIYDEFSHASIRDGIRLSVSRSFSFAHNDVDDLKKKIKQASGQIFIVTESIFSMDGDVAPLKEMAEIAKSSGAYLIVDEAHAVGIFGNNGSGLVNQLGLNEEVFIRIVTFGKGAGMHGAAAICSDEVKKYLVNFCRPFIYSTALPPSDCVAIMTAHEVMKEMDEERKILQDHLRYFRQQMGKTTFELIAGNGPICAVIISGNEEVKKVSTYLQKNGLGVLPVLSPTVPEGKERLRIIIHSYNTKDELDQLIELLVGYGK